MIVFAFDAYGLFDTTIIIDELEGVRVIAASHWILFCTGIMQLNCGTIVTITRIIESPII